MQDTIERSIDIAAPLERVWELVTRPGWWVPDEHEATGDRTPGAVTVRSSQKWGTYPVQVVELRPRTYAAFRWASQFSGTDGTDLVPGHTTLVEFTLVESADAVRFTVVESGFAALDAPEEVKRSGLEANSGGWDEEMEHLRRLAAESAAD